MENFQVRDIDFLTNEVFRRYHVDTVGKPYLYAGNNPVNSNDPEGLLGLNVDISGGLVVGWGKIWGTTMIMSKCAVGYIDYSCSCWGLSIGGGVTLSFNDPNLSELQAGNTFWNIGGGWEGLNVSYSPGAPGIGGSASGGVGPKVGGAYCRCKITHSVIVPINSPGCNKCK